MVIYGISELDWPKSRDRVSHDFIAVCNVLDFLNVVCNLVNVSRQGKGSMGVPSHSRPLKVLLPARAFQRFAVNCSRPLRFYSEFCVFLRESFPPEELKRRCAERDSTRIDGICACGSSPPGSGPAPCGTSTPSMQVVRLSSNVQ